MEPNRNDQPSEESRDERYIDHKTREKIRKHISDPNDKITSEDIENVDTDMYNRPETEEEKKADEKEWKEEHPPKAGSAWDIDE
jgi:hypothetical protein